jgi:hypothetical protein
LTGTGVFAQGRPEGRPVFRAVVLFVVLLTAASVGAFPVEVHGGTEDLRRSVASEFEREGDRVAAYLNVPDVDMVTVLLVESEERYRAVLPGVPEWSEAAAVPDQRIIVIRTDLSHWSRPRSQVIAHELSHVLLHDATGGGRVPLWLDEGLAVVLSSQWSFYDDVRVARARLTGSLIPLSRIERLREFAPDQAALAYAESALAVQYFIREYGRRGLEELFAAMRDGRTFAQAIRDVTGERPSSFDDEALASIRKRYDSFVAASGGALTSLLLLAVAIVVFVKRRRAIRRRMDELEDWEDPGFDDWQESAPPT